VTRATTPVARVWRPLCGALLLAISAAAQTTPALQQRAGFASEVARLSEPQGDFDTDNLISNERDYLSVIPDLVARGVRGGTYLGVGPDQNFSYIARIRPTRAYIIDIRRDNLLLHLLFKALFSMSGSRIEYLCLLTGRVPPPAGGNWTTESVDEIVGYVEGRGAGDAASLIRQVERTVAGFGVPLSDSDVRTLDRFHRTFITEGLGLRFRSFGRAPQPYYPTFRDLLVARDRNGRQWNYLASEDDFLFLKSLEDRDAIVPVVGNVAGTEAMPRIAGDVNRRGDRVSAFYISNVETYLYGSGQRSQFLDNVRSLPQDSRSVLIRSIFSGAGFSTSVVEPLTPAR
jgi:hypothetical protein